MRPWRASLPRSTRSASIRPSSARGRRPKQQGSSILRCFTIAHQNAHLAMFLRRIGFAVQGPVPRGALDGALPLVLQLSLRTGFALMPLPVTVLGHGLMDAPPQRPAEEMI